MNKKLIILGFLLPFLLIGCANKGNGGNDDPSHQDPGGEDVPISVTSVSLNKTSMEIYTDDTDASLVATVLPENATNKNVTWSSSNNTVATVSDGKITPLKVGNTTITVTTEDGNKKATCSLTIKEFVKIPNYVLHGLFYGKGGWTDEKMKQNPSDSSEYMIQGIQLYANDLFKIHMSGNTWYGYSALKSSVPSGLVTQGSSDDNIKVLATGTYDIYSSYNESDGGHIYLAKVGGGDNPVSVTGVSLSHSGKLLTYRITDFKLTATISPSNATNKEVTWKSSDTSIATVTTEGRIVTYQKTGTTTITVTTVDGNKTAECIIYVCASGIPDYYLTGTINGRDYSAKTYTYAAIPLGTNRYLIPDVELIKGDKLNVRGDNGNPAILKDRYNQNYVYNVDKAMSVNIYLNPKDENYNYLTFVNK